MAYQWRDFDAIVAAGTYGGSADYALVYGALARALGIPTVWVKTMDATWIRAFERGPVPAVWSGHVFLELHDGRRWVLLDPTLQLLYDDYDPRSRLLPGDRYAYDKGLDPYELVLSTRWEEWKEQARDYFSGFDLSQLPVPAGRSVLGERTVFLAGANPGWDLAHARIESLGWSVSRSGNSDFASWMPLVQGRTLVVLRVGGADPLPAAYSAAYEDGYVDEARRHAGEKAWAESRNAPDGTRVVVVYGVDERALSAAIGSLAL